MVEETPLRKKRNFVPCETAGCHENCAYAYSCQANRMGRSAVFWPGAGLIMLIGFGTFF